MARRRGLVAVALLAAALLFPAFVTLPYPRDVLIRIFLFATLAQAWNILVWFATLVTLAGGLAETKFLEWLVQALAPTLQSLTPAVAAVSVVSVYFFLHYFFASITAHAASMLPVFIGLAVTIPGLTPKEWALLLAYPLGLMGVLTTYTAGHNPIYYGSGYISRQAFWVLGFILGVFFLTTYLIIAVPWLNYLGF